MDKGKPRRPRPKTAPKDKGGAGMRSDRQGTRMQGESNAMTRVEKARWEKRKSRFIERIERTARAELLNQEPHGGIEFGQDEGSRGRHTDSTDDDNEEDTKPSYMLRQSDIVEAVDIVSATKHFELNLNQFGPYRVDYTQNGRYILLGGRKGHLAAFDWMTKDLKNETNVMESIRDVQWLHVENMCAVAQKRWLRIYDQNGTELHCIKSLFDVKRLNFLTRHMLLVASSNNSFLHYLDVSIGKLVASFPTKHGALDVMTHNPSNAIVLTGSAKGVVSMWSPNSKEPLIELFTHHANVRGIAVDSAGQYMATTGLDRKMRIWDLRNYKEMHSYKTPIDYGEVVFSQRRYVAVAAGNSVQIFNDAHLGKTTAPYMVHSCESVVSDLQFCPYEDVLGVAHGKGFVSLLVPGAGDPNFDALRENPFESKKQRQEREVRMLLDKIQPEMITLNPADINRVNLRGLEETLDYKSKQLRIKPRRITRK